MKPIHILAVGGTIDAEEYDFTQGKVIRFGEAAVRAVLRKVRPDIPVDANLTVFPQKDSSEMTDEDRERIRAFCLSHPCKRIVITHGTDTMRKTGWVLTGLLQDGHMTDKTIVLTGSLPYYIDPEYAAFNIGSAITACQILPAGVYIAMGGEIVPIELAEKVRVHPVNFFVAKDGKAHF